MLQISFPYTAVHTYSPVTSSNYSTFLFGNFTDFTPLHSSPSHQILSLAEEMPLRLTSWRSLPPPHLLFSYQDMSTEDFRVSLDSVLFVCVCVCSYFQVTSSCSLMVPSSVMSTNISCGLATKKSALAHVTMPTSSQPKPFASVT